MKIDGTVSFIGAGNMGEAMIKGLIKSGLAAKSIKAMRDCILLVKRERVPWVATDAQ